ncbi:helix-turn-helix domain-containing protein [Providencia rustigianii]|uniref:helix-turn-helix domain-containing protein n=1 Tax=Providencia rustigianii TaxID=158850 RepID=UPI000F6BDBB3|nr:helix-turn-helix transcriptional regulator [Providencia rustigianii]MTC59664.1 helix-turn-helix domain-containing protein [Providencia rustigianii]VEH52989.1 Antitoxin PezA [Providencia rustigianii]
MNRKFPIAYAVGQKVKSLRKSQGYTVFQLARECNISEQQLFRYERGVNRIDIDCLARVSKILNVNISDIFSDIFQEDLEIKPVHKTQEFVESFA